MEQDLVERVINERKGKDMSKFLLTGLTVTAQSLIDRHQVPYLGKRPCIQYCITMASNSNTVVFYIVNKERC